MTEIREDEIVDAEIVNGNDTKSLKKFNPGRSGLKLIATSSVRFVVSSAITTLVPVETKKEKRKVFVASMVLSGMLNEQVKPYVDREIDEAIDFCKGVVEHINKMQQAQAEAAESDVPNP